MPIGSHSRQSTEENIADLFGYGSAALFGRARSALTALLETLGNGIEIPFLIPSNICPSIFAAGLAAKTRVIAIDVDPETGLPSDKSFCEVLDSLATPGVVMPTHLYGFAEDYPETTLLAKNSGWYVLENDASAVTAREDKQAPRTAIGDALLVSFGTGKVIDGGGGGAVLSDDTSIIAELKERAGNYPILDAPAKTLEMQLTIMRRMLRNDPPSAQNMVALYEKFLPYELAGTRFSLSEDIDAGIGRAINLFSKNRAARREHAAEWQGILSALGSNVIFSPLLQPSPWRFVARLPKHRNRVIERLREKGIDGGVNYPSLHEFFPNILGGKATTGGRRWGEEVINLWLTDDYNKVRKFEAAEVIRIALEGSN